MANALKILGQLNPTANTQGNVYVVPASTAAIVNNITVANQSASNASYSIIVMPSGSFSATAANTFFIVRGGVVPASDTASLGLGVTLPAGAILAANTNSGSLSISAFGVEIS
jgi:hypothetical protein